ncbi:MAG: hypothetical protein FWG14_00455 [Peptococcaceae bacterium]|nr:hypothetical protein [Peptococcaceae bacterium]
MKLYSYYLVHPLDWEFCLMEVDEYKKWLKENDSKNWLRVEVSEILIKLDEILEAAMEEWKKQFSRLQKELRCPPLVFPIPEGCLSGKTTFCVVLKRNEDGDTIVYSPVPLTYLEQDTQVID